MQEKNLSEQLTQQMKRKAAAHTDHLNQVLTTQQRELTRRHQSQLELEAAQHKLARNQDLAKLADMAKGIRECTRQCRHGSCSSASAGTLATDDGLRKIPGTVTISGQTTGALPSARVKTTIL